MLQRKYINDHFMRNDGLLHPVINCGQTEFSAKYRFIFSVSYNILMSAMTGDLHDNARFCT